MNLLQPLRIFLLLANAVAFAPIPTQYSGARSGRLFMAATGSEIAQRKLLEARLKLEGKGSSQSAPPTTISSDIGSDDSVQRALLEERIRQDLASTKAQNAAEEAARAAAAAAAVKKAEEDRIAAEKKKKAEEEEEAARIAKAKEEEEKAKAKAEAEASKAKEEAARILAEAEAARVQAQEEAAAAAQKKEEAAAKEAEAQAKAEADAEAIPEARSNAVVIQTEAEAAAAAKMAEQWKEAEARSQVVSAQAQAQYEELAATTKALKDRVESFGDRISSIDFSKVLPSGDDILEASSAITKFVENPRQATKREESTPDLVRVAASGAANALVDGLGTGIELVDSFRDDDELKSVVGDALGNAGTAVKAVFNSEDDNLERKGKTALLAVDSLGVAAYASLCGLVGYSQSGTPVAESASKAAKGFVQAFRASLSLVVRSFDSVGDAIQQGQQAAAVAMENGPSSNPVEQVSSPTSTKKKEFSNPEEEDVKEPKESATEEEDTKPQPTSVEPPKDPQRALLEARLAMEKGSK